MLLSTLVVVTLHLGVLEGRDLWGRELERPGEAGAREPGARHQGGCRVAGLCCQGQNITCSSQGPRLNNPTSETCFCDEICAIIGDCCTDYKYNCPAVDCVLSDGWSEWTECDRRCGLGMSTRSRAVLVPPLNGGKRCGQMIERRQCEGKNCIVARASESVDELKGFTGRHEIILQRLGLFLVDQSWTEYWLKQDENRQCKNF